MKIIKAGNGHKVAKMEDRAVPIVLDCDECGSQFEVTVSDCERIGDEYYVDCPCCANRILLKHIDFYPHETPKFPADFFHYDENSVPIEDERINEWIKDIQNRIKTDSDPTFYMIGTGDSAVIALVSDEEVVYYVAKNYYELTLDRQN